MYKRFLAAFAFAVASMVGSLPAVAQIETRSIERSENSDYFGFDLRTTTTSSTASRAQSAAR